MPIPGDGNAASKSDLWAANVNKAYNVGKPTNVSMGVPIANPAKWWIKPIVGQVQLTAIPKGMRASRKIKATLSTHIKQVEGSPFFL